MMLLIVQLRMSVNIEADIHEFPTERFDSPPDLSLMRLPKLM